MKKFLNYFIDNYGIISVVTLIICSFIFTIRENVTFKAQTVSYINISIICIMLLILYNAVKKRHMRWRYLTIVLLCLFVFNRFYNEVIFFNQFHFRLQYFLLIIFTCVTFGIFFPLIKERTITIWSKISISLGKWTDERNQENKQHMSKAEARNHEKEDSIKRPDVEDVNAEFKFVSSTSGTEKGNDGRPNGRPNGKEKFYPILYGIVFIVLLVVPLIFIYVLYSTQATIILEKIKVENVPTVIASLMAIILLLVFIVGIFVSLLVKWTQIILEIIKNKHKGEVYFIIACFLFFISQNIFDSASPSIDNVANFLIEGKLFTFPLILSILIPIFLIFVENIDSYVKNNQRIEEACKICRDEAIEIASSTISSLLKFIKFVTSDYLSTIIEFTEDSFNDSESMDRTTLTDFFEEIEATEEYNRYFCSIAEAISILVLGSLCGLKNVSQIHQWAESERVSEFLKEKFGINHIPCYYWLLVMLKMVKTDTLNQCLMRWAAQFLPKNQSQTTTSLNGKTICSTTGMKHMGSPLHIISAQICELGITLASEKVSTKSNEIPTVQELLKKMDIEECLIVADALNCQQKTAEIIVKGKGDYLLNTKGNQPNLEREISEYVQDDMLRKGMDCERKTEKNRGQTETRTAYSTGDVAWLYGKEKWKNLNCVGAIKKEFEKNGRKTEEWHYYISSRKLSATELLHHAQMEWAEETMHWLLDVHYEEDYCRIENRTIQQNLNLLQKFSISLLKQYKTRISSKRTPSKIMLDCLLEPSKICDIFEN